MLNKKEFQVGVFQVHSGRDASGREIVEIRIDLQVIVVNHLTFETGVDLKLFIDQLRRRMSRSGKVNLNFPGGSVLRQEFDPVMGKFTNFIRVGGPG